MWRLLVGLGPLSAIALAQVDGGGGTLPGGYISVGLISSAITGLGVVLSGKIVVPTFAYIREKERADKWEAEAMRLNSLIAERHVPALESATHALTKSSEVVEQAIAALGRRKP